MKKSKVVPRGWFGDYPDWLAYDEEEFITTNPIYSEIKIKKARVAKRRYQKAKAKK